jgi:hypothetical protein
MSAELFFGARIDQAAIKRIGRNSSKIQTFGDERRAERDDRAGVSRSYGETRHAPKVDGFFDRLFQILEVYLFDVRHNIRHHNITAVKFTACRRGPHCFQRCL